MSTGGDIRRCKICGDLYATDNGHVCKHPRKSDVAIWKARAEAAEAVVRHVVQNGERREFLSSVEALVPDKLIEAWLATLPKEGAK